MELPSLRFAAFRPADAQYVLNAATHPMGDVDTARLACVDDRGSGIAEDDHAGVLADSFERNLVGVLVACVRDFDPVSGLITRLTPLVVILDLAFLLRLHLELHSAGWPVQHRCTEGERRDVELDGLPDLILKMG